MSISGINSSLPLDNSGETKASRRKKKKNDSNTQTDKFESDKKEELPEGQLKKWLFLNYVAADCNLTDFQLGNIDQQEKVGSDKNTHIVALVDVGHDDSPYPLNKNQANPNGTWSGAKTLYVTKDSKEYELNSKVIEEHGERFDMSDPETLKNFIVSSVKKFPAEHVALILNDHGGGFTGAMEDRGDGDFMSVPGMGKAIAGAEEITGKKIDIIGFDACLMAEAEVAYELKDHANIYLASEENEGGTGWSYDTMLGKPLSKAISRLQSSLENKIDISPEEFAKVVVDINRENSRAIPTFSATDLSKMDGLKDSVNLLAEAIINSDEKTAIKKSMEKSEHYGNREPYTDLHDLYHMSDYITKYCQGDQIKKAAENVKETLESAVIANENNPKRHPNSHGLSLYAPISSSMSSGYYDLQFAKDTKWDEALESLGVEKPYKAISLDRWSDGSPRKQK